MKNPHDTAPTIKDEADDLETLLKSDSPEMRSYFSEARTSMVEFSQVADPVHLQGSFDFLLRNLHKACENDDELALDAMSDAHKEVTRYGGELLGIDFKEENGDDTAKTLSDIQVAMNGNLEFSPDVDRATMTQMMDALVFANESLLTSTQVRSGVLTKQNGLRYYVDNFVAAKARLEVRQ